MTTTRVSIAAVVLFLGSVPACNQPTILPHGDPHAANEERREQRANPKTPESPRKPGHEQQDTGLVDPRVNPGQR